jgi:heme A synthase
MHDLMSTAHFLCEYTSAVMLLAITYHCWRLDRRGKSTKTPRVSYFALACLLLLFMALPLSGVDKLPSYYDFFF